MGAGHFSKFIRATGDMRYGAIAEYVDLKNTVYGTNGITLQTVFDLDGGLVARDTDYWDSREVGLSDIVGPANEACVVVPFGPIHPGGVPRSSSSRVPPGNLPLAVGPTGASSASLEMQHFAQSFHEALSYGSAKDIAEFFTDDAVYVNPLLHQGAPLYPNLNQTIQVKGRRLITRLFSATLSLLPDCRGSKLVHIVGGPSGGGFEWKAGGSYSNTGIDRTGLNGTTALDLFDGRTQRMSVKFDTFQMGQDAYGGGRQHC